MKLMNLPAGKVKCTFNAQTFGWTSMIPMATGSEGNSRALRRTCLHGRKHRPSEAVLPAAETQINQDKTVQTTL